MNKDYILVRINDDIVRMDIDEAKKVAELIEIQLRLIEEKKHERSNND